MMKRIFWRLTLAAAVLLTGLGLSLPAAADIPASERAVLEDLYNGTDGANWTNNSNWMDAAGTECN